MSARKPFGFLVTLSSLLIAGSSLAWARQDQPGGRGAAAVVVTGTVQGVYQNTQAQAGDRIIAIQAEKVEIGPTPARVLLPVPGDVVYAHVLGEPSARTTPAPRSQVRAHLQPRRAGGWLAVGPDAFELIGDVAAANPAPAPTPTPAPRGSGSILDALGISAEELKIQGHYALRVSALERNGAGKQAGLEVGDVIIGANNQPLSSLADLSKLAKPGEELQLVVVDVNSGKPAQVAVAVPATVASNAPRTTNAPRPAPPAAAPGAARRSLGLSAEPVSLGQRTALKVVAVEPESPAAKAGLEPGDVIVEANDIPITGVEQLAAALRKSGSVLNLTVRNVRNNQDTLVPVQLGGATLAPVPPDLADDVPAPTRAGSATGGLGAVTELTFYDIEAAVKVTEVEPGSPALRAGIEVGDIIVEANGKPVLHPNDLTEIVRQSGSTLKLTVVDPRKGQKTPVDVNLGGR